MAGYIVLGSFAAFGVLSTLWALLGWLVPSGSGCAVVCIGQPDEAMLWRYRWLTGLGLLSWPLLVVTEEPIERSMTEICSREALLTRLERERNQFDGTGNGDHSGRGQRRGISEL